MGGPREILEAFMVQATEQFCQGRKFLYKEKDFLAEAFFCSTYTLL